MSDLRNSFEIYEYFLIKKSFQAILLHVTWKKPAFPLRKCFFLRSVFTCQTSVHENEYEDYLCFTNDTILVCDHVKSYFSTEFILKI